MKRDVSKKLISMVLAVSLALPMTAAFAEDGTEEATAPVSTAEQSAFEEQLRAAEEERRAEEEARLAEEEERLAEMEKEREEMKKNMPPVMSHEEAAKRQAALDRQVGNIGFNGSVSLFSAGDYSEVVYIETVEDLIAIDGHDGGYYELKNDLDLSGIEWEPLTLTDATFNGNGFAIKNMTITKQPEKSNVLEIEAGWVETIYCAGMFVGTNIYVNDLALENVNINFSGQDHYYYVAPMGLAYSNKCTIEAEINVELRGETKIEADEFVCMEVTAIGGGANCNFVGNITATNSVPGASLGVRGLVSCVNGSFAGNINMLRNANGAYLDAAGIANGGDFFASSAQNCVFNGNITAKSKSDTDGYAFISGIGVSYIPSEKLQNCSFIGDIVSNGGAYGICQGSNNSLVGNVTATGGEYCNAYGIYYGSNNSLIGNVTATGGEYCNAYGIYGNGSGNYVSGIIRATNRYDTTTASASRPYRAVYKCPSCGALYKSSDDSYYCYNHYYSDGSIYPRYCSAVTVAGYSDSSSGETTEPETPETEGDAYSIQIMESEADLPIADAVINLDGKEYTTDENGMAVVNQSRFVGGLSVSLGGQILYTQTDWTAINGQVNVININGFDIEPEDFHFGNNASISLRGPEIKAPGGSFPLFEQNMSFDMSFLDIVSIAYDKEENEYQVLLGMKYDDDAIKKNDASDPTWRKKYSEIRDFYNKMKRGEHSDEYIKRFNETEQHDNPKFGKIGIEGQIGAYGFLSVKPEGDGAAVEGGLVITMSGSAESSVPVWTTPPVYLAFSLSGELGASLSVELENAFSPDPQANVKGAWTASLTPSVGIGVGVKDLLGLEAGIEGELEGKLEFPMDKIEESLTFELSGSYYVVLYALIHEFRFSDTLVKAQLYPYFELQTASLYSEEDFTSVDRGYLSEVSLMSAEDMTLKTGVYPYANVQTAKLSDGRTVMVWTDDDAERTDANRTALYYRVLSDGVWSDAEQLDSDGTADFDFALTSSGGKAYIVWQDANREITGEDSLTDTAAASELMYSEFDGSAWSEPTAVTSDNGSYEYSPAIYSDGSDTYVMWTQNESNNPIPGLEETMKESVYTARISGSAAEVYSDMAFVCGSAVGAGGATAVISDSDGDLATDGSTLYLDGEKVYESEYNLSELNYVNGGFVFSENGSVKRVYPNGSAAVLYSGGGQNITLLSNGSGYAAVYEVQEGYSSNLYAAYQTGGVWTSPVRITDFDEKIRSWSAEFDGTDISVAATLADISVDGGNMSQSVSLVYTAANPIEDIQVNGIYTDEAVSAGSTVEFEIDIENNTKSTLETVHITLTGDTAGELYNGDVSVYIPSGENKYVTVRVTVPEDFVKQAITATVTSDVTEIDDTNNSVAAVFGEADLTVKLSGSQIEKSGYASVTVENTGCADAENTVIALSCDGNELYTENIGTLAAGEKKVIQITVDESSRAEDKTLFVASAVTSSEERYDYNNKDYYTLGSQTVLMSLSESIAYLAPGESYAPQINTYPQTDISLYAVSSDETVATVDENGKITAVANGEAKITYMSPDTVMSKSFTVYVRNQGTPGIVSAEYEDYSEEYGYDYPYGTVKVVVDTSACLAEGETENLIMAVYDENGALIGVTIKENVSASESDNASYAYRNTMPARVKIMLWDSLSGMKPKAYAVEAEVTQQTTSE